MAELSWEKLLVIAIVVLILFGGAKKIPEMMRGMGRGVREFNDAKKGITGDDSSNTKSSAQNQKSTITDVEHEAVSSK